MKRVTGEFDVRALGCYKFEFYVDDNTTEEGYEEYTKTCYRKKS